VSGPPHRHIFTLPHLTHSCLNQNVYRNATEVTQAQSVANGAASMQKNQMSEKAQSKIKSTKTQHEGEQAI
jgi:hypothetical protein